MPSYWSMDWGAKLATFAKAVRHVKNWPAAIGLRMFQGYPRMRLLTFRNGLNVVCRGHTSDWSVVSELALAGGYGLALTHLRGLKGRPIVLDLGGNIGVFSLLAARCHEQAVVHTYEPGPPNFRQCEINRLLNPTVAERIHLIREAVGGETRMTEFFYDDQSPQSSGLYGRGSSYPVQIRSFSEVVNGCGGAVALAKIDIEGAEFELLDHTPSVIWRNVGAISIEVHDDPKGKLKLRDFLDRLAGEGFRRIEQEPVGPSSFFLRRG